jgi:hypothetical protein
MQPLASPSGEISEAARETQRKLRIVKYRMLFIFLLLPALLVGAIVFDWLWDLGPTPVERAPNPAAMPIPLSKARSTPTRPEDTKSKDRRSRN